MIDIDQAARDFLLTDSAVSATLSGRVWASTDTPPAEYDPAVGGAVCLQNRGGVMRYERLLSTSIQTKCYGLTAAHAWDTYKLVADAFDEKSGAVVRWSQIEVLGQVLEEPDTGRWFVLGFFQLIMAPEP